VVIPSDQLDTPEDGLVLRTREDEKPSPPGKGQKKHQQSGQMRALRERNEELETEITTLRERLKQARRLPLPKGGHCLDCLRKGAAAAIDFVEER
jgi:hypothetical protein